MARHLAQGQAADVPVAWLDVSSSRFGYAALLEVGPAGFVRRYPGLWEAEP